MARPLGSRDSGPRTNAVRRAAEKYRLGLKVLPLDVMAKVMEYFWFKAVDEVSGAIKDQENAMLAFDCAERCAPYLHPRLSPINEGGVTNTQIVVTFSTPHGPISRGQLAEAPALPEAGSGDILPG